ncbi:MAG: hypothetical protein WC823_03905 [Parcubacteria group bacterium]|jgi:hypothetical protein
MKKTFVMAFLLMFGMVSQTQAVSTSSSQGGGNAASTTQTANKTTAAAQGNQTGNAVQTTEQNKVMNQGEATQIQTQDQTQVQAQNEVRTKDKTKESKGKFNADSHRSAIANFVQSLSAVADRENGIGQEVRTIAQQQNAIKDRAADLINAVENRNAVKTFLIGTSYSNLGELRSQMVQTKNQIEQLKRLAERAENEGDRIELQNQIQVLEREQTNSDSFIAQNESKFSLFGWAVKLFRK